MQRVLIIGNCASGKSTLAKKLHAITQLPIIHLDQHYWNPGWIETPKEMWEAKIKVLSMQESYIMDGNYSGTLAMRLKQSDTLIYLEQNSLKCFWRAVKRILKYKGRTRPDMHEGCPERFDIDFLHYILAFRWIVGGRIEKILAANDYSAEVIRLKDDKSVEAYLESL